MLSTPSATKANPNAMGKRSALGVPNKSSRTTAAAIKARPTRIVIQAAAMPMRWKLRRRLSVLLYIAAAFLDAAHAEKQL
jgi:hypothetical protein